MGDAPAVEPYVLSILVMPAQENTLGVMHGGHMKSWMDMAAWVVATRAVAADQAVYFKGSPDVSSLTGKPVKLYFKLKRSKLFAFQFTAE